MSKKVVYDIGHKDTVRFGSMVVPDGKGMPTSHIDNEALQVHGYYQSTPDLGNSSNGSTSYVQIPRMTFDVTLEQAADVLVMVQGTFYIDNAGGTLKLRAKMGEVTGTEWETGFYIANRWRDFVMTDVFEDVAPGSYTMDLDWAKGTVGTVAVHSDRRYMSIYAVYR